MTTHIFIVDENTFPIHLQYMFAGTGAGDKDEHIPLLADIKRLRPGDEIIFYLLNVGFYGIFKVAKEEKYVFVDNSKTTYLQESLKKKLIYRAKIEPYIVYENYISEWDALDKLPLYAQDVIWSLIYRKLKGNRGCTPITPDESRRLIEMISNTSINALPPINNSQSYTWNKNNRKIEIINKKYLYNGPRDESPDLITLMIKKYNEGHAFEDILQAFFTENIGINKQIDSIAGSLNNIIWIGNEVFCSVGMQKIDIFTILSDERDNKEFRIIELKDEGLAPQIAGQIEKYTNWTNSYLKNAINSNIQPIVVAKSIEKRYRNKNKSVETKAWRDRELAISAIKQFNNKKISKIVKIFEFKFSDDNIIFEEATY